MPKIMYRVSACGLLLASLLGLPAHAQTSEAAALHVLNRVAYGPRPGDVQRVMAMGVEVYIDEQLHPERISLAPALREQLAAMDYLQKSPGDLLALFRPAGKRAGDAAENQEARRQTLRRTQEQLDTQRLLLAIESPRQLEEVLVDFWFNHFNVYANKGLVRVLTPAYEREAIRPHVLGHFRDLLKATARHPAMLYYLDNWQSVAEGFSPAFFADKKNVPRGLNENYARELMELHTLGVDGGYTQQDVTELARMLTGWTFLPRDLSEPGKAFRFDASRHDKGVKHWLGRTVQESGIQEGEMALDVLAEHPASARHISYKLAQYFVADEPPAALVQQLAERFTATHGDIRAVLTCLFASAEFQQATQAGSKFKTPYQYVVSAARASAIPVQNVRPYAAALAQLGQPLYACVTPDGYKNTQLAWLNADALARRINFATSLASGKLPLAAPPNEEQSLRTSRLEKLNLDNLVERQRLLGRTAPVSAEALLQTLGASISAATREQIAIAEPGLRAALVLGSPDFMWH